MPQPTGNLCISLDSHWLLPFVLFRLGWKSFNHPSATPARSGLPHTDIPWGLEKDSAAQAQPVFLIVAETEVTKSMKFWPSANLTLFL